MADASSNAAADSKPSTDRSSKTRSDRNGDESKDNEAEQPRQSSAHVSPVTRLYRHALESIFAFLRLRELGRVLSVSRSWSAAVRSMPSIGATVQVADDASADSRPLVRPSVIAASGLVSHIAAFGSSLPLAALASDQLLVLRQSFPSLTSLGCAVRMRGRAPLLFSSHLRQVKIALRGGPVALMQATMGTLSQLPQLTDLSASFQSWFPSLDFSPLLGAASLRHLRLEAGLKQPTDAQIDQLRSLAHLQSMVVPWLDSASLQSLLRTPHQLQWQRIGRVEDVDEVEAAALSCLPTLTALKAHVYYSIAFLQSLPRLRTLDLQVPEDISADAVVADLCCCLELTTLTLVAPVTSAHMSTILAALPLLTDLTVQDCSHLESLSFLESVDWSQRAALQRLSISNPMYGRCIPVECASTLYCLRSLTSLTLHTAFRSQLDAETLQSFEPPSALFPLLTQFRHRYSTTGWHWDPSPQ